MNTWCAMCTVKRLIIKTACDSESIKKTTHYVQPQGRSRVTLALKYISESVLTYYFYSSKGVESVPQRGLTQGVIQCRTVPVSKL